MKEESDSRRERQPIMKYPYNEELGFYHCFPPDGERLEERGPGSSCVEAGCVGGDGC